MRLIVHAPNVHEGGGASLLRALMTAPHATPRVFTVDSRFVLPDVLAPAVSVIRVRPAVGARLKAEYVLSRSADSADVVLCMGNLPPLFRVRGSVLVFIQNRLLLDDDPLQQFPVRVRARIRIERVWLRAAAKKVRRVIVQTPSMQRAVRAKLGIEASLLPFTPDAAAFRGSATAGPAADPRFDFVYVSSALPHKNHRRLLNAWRLLAEENVRPTLCVTVSQKDYPELCRELDEAVTRHRLLIINAGELTRDEIASLYTRAGALIYPSLAESFGLPLIEAAAAKIPIIASELDYVRDLMDPAQTFDPTSPVSIARAVKRHLQLNDEKAIPCNPAEFVERVVACRF